jgi:hypothetical protein
MVCKNGAIIMSPGLFDGELVVVMEPSCKSIIAAMNVSYPDTKQIVSVFYDLVQKSFLQCIYFLQGIVQFKSDAILRQEMLK